MNWKILTLLRGILEYQTFYKVTAKKHLLRLKKWANVAQGDIVFISELVIEQQNRLGRSTVYGIATNCLGN